MSARVTKKNTKKVRGESALAKAKTRNAKSRNDSNGEAFHVIERLIARRYWSKARAAIQELLVFAPLFSIISGNVG